MKIISRETILTAIAPLKWLEVKVPNGVRVLLDLIIPFVNSARMIR